MALPVISKSKNFSMVFIMKNKKEGPQVLPRSQSSQVSET
nr:MAG TPA: hypothetical protein [Caudoviricetes sp.]